MNSAFSPEMLNCLNSNSENTSVLERRQRSRLKWQQEQMYFNGNEHLGGVFLASNDHGFGEMLLGGAMKPDPDIEIGWSHDFGSSVLNYGISGFELEASYPNAIPRTVSCPPNMAAAMAEVAASKAALGKESFKKRKADRTQSLKAIAEENSREKKVKGFTEEDSKITEQSSNSKSTTTTATNSKGLPSTNNNSSKDNSKVSDAPKPDYIHVRARRGQATDSHSLAERVRREKISERMKYLQDLVPGCNKITGKAGMLDEIINYVQSLQRQVEFLSMKLAAINPRLDFDMDNYLNKEIVTASTSSIPIIGVSSEMVNSAHLQFNALDQGVLCTSLGMGVNATDLTLRRTISAPVSIAETFLDSSCLNQIQQLTWDATELQNLYNIECQHGRSTPFITQPFTGFIDSGHVKTEM